MWSRSTGKSNTADGRQIEAGVPALKWGWGSNYVGNESGQIVLLSLMRWVKPLPRPRFPRLSDNKWLPTLRLSVFCFLSNKTSHRKRARETGSKTGGERGEGTPVVYGYLGQFGLFSPTPMNGCRQGISDGHDKISHPRCPTSVALTRPPAPSFQVNRLSIPSGGGGTDRQSKVVLCWNAQM